MPPYLRSTAAALLTCATALAQEPLRARVVLPLDARPLEAAVLRDARGARAVIALDDGRLLGVLPGWPPEAPRELARVPGVPRALVASGAELLVACDRPAAVHLLRATRDAAGTLEIASALALEFSPRALAEGAGDAREFLVVGGDRKAQEFALHDGALQGKASFEAPLAAPHAALALGPSRWLFLSTRERALAVREANGSTRVRALDALPRRALRLDARRYALLCGTPLGGDRVELCANDARELEPLARFDSAGPVCLDACVADFDGDAALDLAVLNAGHGQIELRLGDASGALGLPHTFAAGQVPRRVIPWDADGDGRPGWLVLETAARRVGVLENHAGRDASPEHFATQAGPTAVLLEPRAEGSPIAWVLCESAPGVQRFVDERSSFTPTPGRSLVSPALLANARERLWAYDLARRELLAFDAAGALLRALPLALDSPLGPIACGGRLALGARGASALQLVEPSTGALEERSLGFALRSLVSAMSGGAWALGADGEVHDLVAARTLGERLPRGDVLACAGSSAAPRFALVLERELHFASPGSASALVAVLSAPPSQIALTEIAGELCFAALCPLAHTLETGPFRANAPVQRYGIGLGARSLARESSPAPAWWIASTFSDELLRATVR